MQHHFTVEIAERYGINCAILLDNLVYWQLRNEANNQNFYDGRYWSYNSVKAYKELFPYLSEKQIRGALQKLIDEGLIVSGEYSDNPYDHTKWYSVAEEVMGYQKGQIDFAKRANLELPSGANRNSQKGKSSIIQIENNTYINHIENILSYFNEKTGKNLKLTDNLRKLISGRLKEGFTEDDFKKVIDTKVQKWGKDAKMKQYLRPSTLFAPSHFQEYLNEDARKELGKVWK